MRCLPLAAIGLAASCSAAKSTTTTLGPSAALSLSAISASIRAVATSVSKFPLPMACTGEACTEFTAACQDLNVIQHQNGTFYRISKDNGTGTGLVLASAPALSGPWVLQHPIFGPDDAVLADFDYTDRSNTSLWTPELHYVNGVYYLYYAIFNRNAHPGGFSVRVATSPSMADGSWTDHGNIGIPTTAGTAAIDASVLIDYDAAPYGIAAAHSIVWGSFGSGLYGMELNPSNLTELASDPPTLLVQDQLFPVSGKHPGNNRTGGSFHARMNGYVYYFFDVGQCCAKQPEDAYIVQVCRASNATGPYYDRNGLNCAGNPDGSLNGAGTTILQSHSPDANGKFQVLSPGSVGIVSTDQGPIITYQYANQTNKHSMPLAFSFGHNYLAFDDQGWPYLSETPQKKLPDTAPKLLPTSAASIVNPLSGLALSIAVTVPLAVVPTACRARYDTRA